MTGHQPLGAQISAPNFWHEPRAGLGALGEVLFLWRRRRSGGWVWKETLWPPCSPFSISLPDSDPLSVSPCLHLSLLKTKKAST